MTHPKNNHITNQEVKMSKSITIDGIEYVPKDSTTPATKKVVNLTTIKNRRKLKKVKAYCDISLYR